MRIIAGSCRGRRLKSPEDSTIRPTADRVREAIFSAITSRIDTWNGMRVLDLFAGSGALGLEALSRGADQAVFVDQSRQAQSVIRENIAICRMEGKSRFFAGDALKLLDTMEGPFDLIFLDPPYRKGLVEAAIEGILSRQLLAPGGMIYAETEKGVDLEAVSPELECLLSRSYGTVQTHLLEFGGDEAGRENKP